MVGSSSLQGLPAWLWRLILANFSILLMAFTMSLESQVTYALTAFAVSSFNNHSLLSTVYVVQNVVNGRREHAPFPDDPY